MMVAQRKKLQDYLKKSEPKRYDQVIQKLNLRSSLPIRERPLRLAESGLSENFRETINSAPSPAIARRPARPDGIVLCIFFSGGWRLFALIERPHAQHPHHRLGAIRRP